MGMSDTDLAHKCMCERAQPSSINRKANDVSDARYYANSQFERQLDTSDLDLIPDDDFGEWSLFISILIFAVMVAVIGLIAWGAYFGINYVLTVPFGSTLGCGIS